MDKLQFEFKCVAAADAKSNTIIITSITTQENRSFVLPSDDQFAAKHTLLIATTTFTTVKNSIKKGTKQEKYGLL